MRRRHGPRPARRAAPRHARRVSGPVARPLPAVALPGRGGSRARGSTSVFERLLALPERRLLDRLLRGRAWIWLIGALLGGIVAMQVSLLKLNAGISRSIEQSGTLERQNADLEAGIAQLSSSDRVQSTALGEGMVTPPAGDVGYLTARPGEDAARAVAHMRPPSDEAREVMASGGRQPAPVTAAPPTAFAPAATATPSAPATTAATPATAATTTTPAPATTAPAQPQGIAAPAAPGTGAAAATGG